MHVPPPEDSAPPTLALPASPYAALDGASPAPSPDPTPDHSPAPEAAPAIPDPAPRVKASRGSAAARAALPPPPPTFRVLTVQQPLRALWAADPVDLSTVQLDRVVVDAVHVDETRLSQEFAELPTHTARASEVYTRLRERQLKAELHVKRVRAAQAGVIRAHLAAKAGAARVTEAMVAEMLTLDPAVIEAEDVAVYAETLASEARGVLSALNRKAEALVTIGANLRQERAFTGTMYEHPRGAQGRVPGVSTAPFGVAADPPVYGAADPAEGDGTGGDGTAPHDPLFADYGATMPTPAGPRGYRR